MADKITWTTTTVRLGDLIPWEDNPRQMTEAQAERLQKSLEKYGYSQLLEIDIDNNYVDGHQRDALFKAVKELGFMPNTNIEVRQANVAFTVEMRKEYMAWKHEGGAGEWNWEMMPNLFEFDELGELGIEVPEMHFDLFGDDEDPPEDPGAQVDKADALREKWQVSSGQLWQLGSHRLICGDCTDAEVVKRVMGGEKAGAVVTDPPYGIEREGITNDDPEGLRELYDGCLSVLPVTDAVIIAFQSPRLFPVWLDAIRDAEQVFERALWSYKPNGIRFPWRGWILKSDILLVSSIGEPKWSSDPPNCHDIYTYTHEFEIEHIGAWHGSVKSLDEVENISGHTTGDIYDPFLGSGTTLIACERLKRKCRGVEIEPKYVAVTLERWSQMTGDTPVLVD